MKTVQILLSTYNGEKYLEEQLDSILQQDYPNINILVRDDGSTDGTVKILEEYAKGYSQISYYKGENIGSIHSYFDLITNADASYDYYSFSDQDDVWNYNKIRCAIEKLDTMQKDKPLLYCGRTTLVDQGLKPLVSTIKRHKIVPDFGNALVENICTGCTSVINHKLLKLVQEHIPEFTVMHDWWLYLTASNFGEVYYDEESYILYRQHSDNVIGSRSNYYEEFKNRVKNYKNNQGKVSRQAKEYQKIYRNDEINEQLLNNVVGARYHMGYRIKILFTKKIYRQRKMDNMIFKILFLIGHV